MSNSDPPRQDTVVTASRNVRASQIEADRLRYLDSDEFEVRMEAHVRSATQQAAEDCKRLRPRIRDPLSKPMSLISTIMRLLQRLTHAR